MYKVNKKGKKFLYIIIFLLLGLIDFARHTQEQEVWGPLINCEGILLLVIAASAYRLRNSDVRFPKYGQVFRLHCCSCLLCGRKTIYWGYINGLYLQH